MKRISLFLCLLLAITSGVPAVALAVNPCRTQEKSLSTAQKQLIAAERQLERYIRRYDRSVFAFHRTEARALQRIDRMESKRTKALIDAGIWAAQCTLFDSRACKKWSRILQKIVRVEQQIDLQVARANQALSLSDRKIAQAERQIILSQTNIDNRHFQLVDAEINLQRCLSGGL